MGEDGENSAPLPFPPPLLPPPFFCPSFPSFPTPLMFFSVIPPLPASYSEIFPTVLCSYPGMPFLTQLRRGGSCRGSGTGRGEAARMVQVLLRTAVHADCLSCIHSPPSLPFLDPVRYSPHAPRVERWGSI